MTEYVKVAKISEIPENQMKAFEVKGQKILIANMNSKFYAIEDQCPHMGYPLYFGNLEDKVLTCGFHYARFDITTGKALGPVTYKSLKTFKVKIQNSLVLVKL